MGVDATDLFDRYEEDYEEMPASGIPHLEINRMHISQSIEVSTALPLRLNASFCVNPLTATSRDTV